MKRRKPLLNNYPVINGVGRAPDGSPYFTTSTKEQ